jgi:type IV pilus assembly protein PilO
MANDFVAQLAKKPPQVKLAILAAVLAAFGLIYWQFFYSALSDKLVQLQAQRTQLQNDNKRLKEDLDKWNDLTLEKDRLDAKLGKNAVSLPASSELPAFFAHLQKQAAAAGVTIKSWKREGETPVEAYVRVPVAIEVRGTFYQINKYFHLLFQTERIISVENLTLGTPVGRGDDIQVSARFIAATYRQADAPPQPETPPAEAAGKPGEKPATSSGDAKAPPAGQPPGKQTPQEKAKQRTDEASARKEGQLDTAAGVDQPANPATKAGQ